MTTMRDVLLAFWRSFILGATAYLAIVSFGYALDGRFVGNRLIMGVMCYASIRIYLATAGKMIEDWEKLMKDRFGGKDDNDDV